MHALYKLAVLTPLLVSCNRTAVLEESSALADAQVTESPSETGTQQRLVENQAGAPDASLDASLSFRIAEDASLTPPKLETADAAPARQVPLDASTIIDAGEVQQSQPVADASRDAGKVTDAGADARTPSGSLESANDAALHDASDAALSNNQSGKLVFITSASYSAALGGLVGADSLCQSHARQAALAGEFRAWLSTASQAVSDRFTAANAPYVLLDGTVIAQDWTALLSGNLDAPISINELGAPISGDVWTGTFPEGTPYTASDCLGFTTNGSDEAAQGAPAGTLFSALCGSSRATDETWSANLVPACATRLHLYCFQQ